MSADIDQGMLDTLTPEEREAIAGDELDPQERAALERIAATAGDGDDVDDDEDDDGEGGDATAPVEGSAEPAAAEEAEPAQAEAAQRAAPAYTAELPADFDDRVKAIADKEADLKARFRSGEIEFDEFEEQRDTLAAERAALDQAKIKAEISREMSEQAAQQAWVSAVSNLADAAVKPENGGIDYRADAEKTADLDGFIRMLSTKQEHAGKPMEWFLQEAHRRVLALHGITPSAKPGPAKPPAADSRKPPLEAVPKSLAGVPGGEGPGDVKGEFSDLDGLEGWELEQALDRMTPAQRERYARAA